MTIQEPEIDIIAKQAFITRQQPLLDEVAAKYGRSSRRLCIKVFYGNPLTEGMTLNDALWGDNPLKKGDPRKNTTLLAGTQIQNILWRERLSPRVYAIFEAEFRGMRVACQLTEFVEGEAADIIQKVYQMQDQIDRIGKFYGFASQSRKMSVNDVIGGKCVDTQLWAFDTKPYYDTVKELYFEKGRYGKIYYQNDERLGLHGGPRKSADREKYMALDKVDFKDKVVWDIGCAGGYFVRYALDHGAKRAIGIDMADPLEAAFHVGNLFGYFNADYEEVDLMHPIRPTIQKPDIVFFLSMNYHVPIPERLFEADTVIFEDNGKTTRQLDKLSAPWTDKYKNIEFVGRGIDHGDKACYILRR